MNSNFHDLLRRRSGKFAKSAMNLPDRSPAANMSPQSQAIPPRHS
jgi:hypothetical protein